MATHSSILAWRIPGTEEPGGLPSLGSHRVRHDWSDLAAAEGEKLAKKELKNKLSTKKEKLKKKRGRLLIIGVIGKMKADRHQGSSLKSHYVSL